MSGKERQTKWREEIRIVMKHILRKKEKEKQLKDLLPDLR